jgi:hypothetical protein
MKLLASIGNLKLGKDTLILNITSATDCPSRKLGLCRLPTRCYALKAEHLYHNVLPFRLQQSIQWYSNSPDALAEMINRKRNIKYLRFSEAGDFRNQSDVDKMDELARLLLQNNIKTYGYTARIDLDFSSVKHMTVNGSGFMVHNQFTAVPDYTTSTKCRGNCRFCNMCKNPTGLLIEVKYH